MRTIAHSVSRIRASPIRKITALLEQAGKQADIISFGGGAPSLAPPQPLMDELGKLASDPRTYKYGSTQGKPELREAISQHLKSNGLDVPAGQIAITVGCTQAIFLSAMALLDEGENAALTDPCYLGYPETFKIFTKRLSWIPLTQENDYQPTQEALERAVTKDTNMLVMVSPDNPTGSVLTKKSAKLLADTAIDNDCYILHDETYKDIIYEDAQHQYLHKLAPEHTIGCFSFSKSASIPGLRIGYVYAEPGLINAIERLQQYVILCPDTLSQMLALKFLEDKTYPEYLKKTVLPTYSRRREAMGRALKKYLPKAKFSIPQGAFYYFPDMAPYMRNMDEEAFSSFVLERARVAVIPGNFFGNTAGRGHIRMTFVSEPPERIEEGIRRVGELLA